MYTDINKGNDVKIDCSVVIVNWNSIDYLRECLRSICEFTRCSCEIIVIDNDSPDEEKILLSEIGNINLILNDKNIGFAAANNLGIRQAKGDYILLLNPDTKLVNDAIDRMVAYLKSHETVSAVGPKLYFSEGYDYHPSIKSLDSPFYNVSCLIPGWRYLENAFQFLVSNIDRIWKVDCVIGAAVLFNRSVFDEVGLLDERFFIYSEEVDFFMRMKRSGHKTVYYPRAEIIHYGGRSQDKSSVAKLEYLWTSKIIYFKKYYGNVNISVNILLIYFLLKTKIILFKKNEFAKVCDLIKLELEEMFMK